MPRNKNLNPVIDTDAILESISDGVFTVDRHWRVLSFNRAAEEITGISRKDAIGRRCSEVFRSSMCENNCALSHTMKSGSPVINKAAFIIDAEGNRIPISVSTALLKDEKGNITGGAETFRDLSLVEELRHEARERYRLKNIFSRSPSMQKIMDVLPRIAGSESNILIQGETGTGKELVARAIHSLSPRSRGPFLGLNCGALPDTLLESELFGYKSGAFTGAVKDKAGRFALAGGGTLLLDEISEISPALQVRLLRVLQEKTYEALGSVKSENADARIIAATNRNLDKMVENGEFRRDLYYRIKVIRIEIPPLRQRKEDIPVLIQHFIKNFNTEQNKKISGVSPDVLNILSGHDFPGNVRELQNIIEHAFVLLDEGRIEPKHLPEEIVPIRSFGISGRNLNEKKLALEAQSIREALERHGGNRLEAAKSLGMHKSTFFRKIRALGIELPSKDGRSSR